MHKSKSIIISLTNAKQHLHNSQWTISQRGIQSFVLPDHMQNGVCHLQLPESTARIAIRAECDQVTGHKRQETELYLVSEQKRYDAAVELEKLIS